VTAKAALAGLAASVALAGLAAGPERAATGPEVAVLLPDSFGRWGVDRQYLSAALGKAGVAFTVADAHDSPAAQRSEAQAAMAAGAKVLLLANVDAHAAAAIERGAKALGVRVIDYDRLTLRGAATFFVSFDAVKVGVLQGAGLVRCLKESGAYAKHPLVAELNGSPSDSNSAAFKRGYDLVLGPLFRSGALRKGPDRWIDGWSPATAGRVFDGMLRSTRGGIGAVVAANDNLAGAVVSVLKGRGLAAIPVTGQDATPQGIQNVISGWQCMTVYKPARAEADAAAAVAVSLLRGGRAPAANARVDDGSRLVPAVLETPIAITKANWDRPIRDGYLRRADVCAGAYARYCR